MLEKSAHGRLSTTSGRRYMLQLFKHWSHKPGTVIDEDQGTIAFEAGNRLTFTVGENALSMVATVGQGADLAHWQGVVETHLKRFAFREEFDLVWSDAQA